MSTQKKPFPAAILGLLFLLIPAAPGVNGQNQNSNQAKEKPRQEQEHKPPEKARTQPSGQQQATHQQQLQRQEQQRQQQQQLQRQQLQRQQQLRNQQLQLQRQQQNLQRQQQLRQQQLQQQQLRRQGLEQQRVPHPTGQELEYQRGPGLRSGQNASTVRALSAEESRQRLQEWNQNRSGMAGINHRPLPAGQVMALSNGHQLLQTRQGTRMELRSNGTLQSVRLRDGRTASYYANGKLGSVTTPGLRIDHGLRGERTIVSEANGRRLVSEGPHRGYLERPYMNGNGGVYVQRTYWDGRRSYTRVYAESYYSGVHYYRYAPVYYYHPAFYAWAYRPWPAVRYQWGWYREPWHAYYQGYFAPAPVYVSPFLWLTDFLLIEDMRLAYQARLDAEAQAREQAQEQAYQEQPPPSPESENPSDVQLSPEVKAAIQAEVQRQVEAERTEATQGPEPNAPAPEVGAPTEAPPPALESTERLFVVSSNLTVSTDTGQECELTPGDAIKRIDDTPGNDNKVRVSVVASKAKDCAVGSTALVGVDDLQEMLNQLQENVDSGLQKLASNRGQGGIPAAPDTTTSPGEVPPPAPDVNVPGQLQEQQNQATETEAAVQEQIEAEEDQAQQ